jgi:hypothetical protein
MGETAILLCDTRRGCITGAAGYEVLNIRPSNLSNLAFECGLEVILNDAVLAFISAFG